MIQLRSDVFLMTIRVLALAGVLRQESWNRKLVALAAERARALGAEIDLLDLREVAMPLYDGDLEASGGLPSGAVAFRQRIADAHAVMISSPEYNHSIPGVLKNAIDWSSRPPRQPWRGKVVALMGASPGPYGAVRMLPDLRKVLSCLGAIVIPTQLALVKADEAFDEAGRLREPMVARSLDALVEELVATTRKLVG